jgi:hypothetical protein
VEDRRRGGTGGSKRRGRKRHPKKLIDYLQEDVPGLEVAYEKFLDRVEEETSDPEWNIQNHPARLILDRFSEGFSVWVAWLEELLWFRHAGYPFDKDDLTVLEWKALAVIKHWNENKGNADEQGKAKFPAHQNAASGKKQKF